MCFKNGTHRSQCRKQMGPQATQYVFGAVIFATVHCNRVQWWGSSLRHVYSRFLYTKEEILWPLDVSDPQKSRKLNRIWFSVSLRRLFSTLLLTSNLQSTMHSWITANYALTSYECGQWINNWKPAGCLVIMLVHWWTTQGSPTSSSPVLFRCSSPKVLYI